MVTHWIEPGDNQPAANCEMALEDATTASMGAVDCPRCREAVELRIAMLAKLSRGIWTLSELGRTNPPA